MSAEREHAVEARLLARHRINRLMMRSRTDDAPTSEEWAEAFAENRSAAMDVAMAEMLELMPKPKPANHHQTTPGRMTLTIRGHA